MGRPRISDERRIATAVRIPESLHRQLRLAASDRDVSANLLVTQALTEYLQRLPAASKVLSTAGQRPTRTGP